MSIRILIADDAIFMRSMLKNILTKADYSVCGEAADGAEAIERYKELKPDLVTMDIVMPGMSGIEVVREIIKIDPNAKILMCSAMGQKTLVMDAIKNGAKDFIVKPFQASRVLEAIENIISK